jgi:hypothetical protein
LAAYVETSNYTLEMPNAPMAFPAFHAAELRRFRENDASLFPHRERVKPGPIVMEDGLEEYVVEEIIDSRWQGRGWQFLVRWDRYGPEHDSWLSASALDDCAALDSWYANGGDGPEKGKDGLAQS